MRRREILKNAASTAIAGSLAATAVRPMIKLPEREARMSKVQANGIQLRATRYGRAARPTFPISLPIMPAMPFRSRTGSASSERM